MVILDRHLKRENPLLDIIYTTNSEGSAQLARHFLEKGHSRFACIAGPMDVPTAQRRLSGFKKELEGAGIISGNIFIYHGRFYYEDGFKLMKDILALDPRPTAVFAGNDLMAWGALEAAKESGLGIPEDIAIAGFDNVFFASLVVPALTTVHQPKFEAGQIAMKMLLEKINSKSLNIPVESKRVELDSQLIVRNSTERII